MCDPIFTRWGTQALWSPLVVIWTTGLLGRRAQVSGISIILGLLEHALGVCFSMLSASGPAYISQSKPVIAKAGEAAWWLLNRMLAKNLYSVAAGNLTPQEESVTHISLRCHAFRGDRAPCWHPVGGFLLGMAGGAARPGPWTSQWASQGTQRRQLLVIGHAWFLFCAHCFFRVERMAYDVRTPN